MGKYGAILHTLNWNFFFVKLINIPVNQFHEKKPQITLFSDFLKHCAMYLDYVNEGENGSYRIDIYIYNICRGSKSCEEIIMWSKNIF